MPMALVSARGSVLVYRFSLPTQSLVLPARQHENTPYAASPGSSGLDDRLVDRCGCNEAFTHLWRQRVQSLSRRAGPIASGSL